MDNLSSTERATNLEAAQKDKAREDECQTTVETENDGKNKHDDQKQNNGLISPMETTIHPMQKSLVLKFLHKVIK